MSTILIRPEQRFAWHGQCLLVTNARGSCGPDDALSGYYFREARHLRDIRFLINDREPWLCEGAEESPARLALSYVHPEMTSFGGGGSGASGDDVGTDDAGIPHRALDIRVRYIVGVASLRIDVEIINHCLSVLRFTAGWELSADFADILETLESRRQQEAPVTIDVQAAGLLIRYGHAKLPYETAIAVEGEVDASPLGWDVTERKLTTALTLDPQQRAWISMTITPRDSADAITADDEQAREAVWTSWMDRLTRFEAPDNSLAEAILRANVRDLASYPLLQGPPDEWLTPQAGTPLYPALFGRDAMTAGWQAAMIDRAEFLDSSLTRLERLQSNRFDDWRDEQPGRIPYQVRQGPLAKLNINPYSAYYADFASPMMFIISLAQLYAWTGDRKLLSKHWDAASRILDWAREYGDQDSDGFLEYLTRSSKGTKNQGWKDSGNAILYDDGSSVAPPIGTCELQGYWYAAQQIFSVLSGVMGRPGDAKAYWKSAAALKERFNRAWWMNDAQFFALAMDSGKGLVHAPSSNVGQCIATGIIDDEHLPATVKRLFEPDMYSGWMIRTLSSEHAAYNPLEYHLGSVWAVENATIVFGLRRFGFDEEASQLTRSMFELAELYPEYRIPECVGGFARRERPHPGSYPRSNRIQLWNSSAFVLLMHTMLGLQPVAALDLLVFDAALPVWLPQVILRDLRIGGATATIRFWRDSHGHSHGEILEKRGTLHLIKQPPPESLRAGAVDRFSALIDRLVHH